MAIRVTCGECGHKFDAPDSKAGKSIACEECDETVRVPQAKAGAPVAKTPKKQAVVEDDDEQDDDDAPRPRKKSAAAEKKSPMLMFLLLGFGGVGLLGAGAAGMYFAIKKDNPQAVASIPQQPGNGFPTSPDTTPESRPTQPTPPTTPATKPETPPTKPEVPIGPKPPVRKESPDAGTIDRLSHATVYIEVEDQRGGGGSGSGWFGLEQNLIITNAHVLGMKQPGSKEPKKITVYVDPGEKGKQQKFEGQKIKILAVDRDMDLALLEIINESNLPKPLKIRPSESLQRLDKIWALGYPGGRRLSEKNRNDDPPTVTISETKVQQLKKDTFGDLYSVQVQGGIVHGNSGGPICDAEGDVVAVAVRVDLDSEGRLTNIAYGVPTEYVRGLIAGRISTVEYGTAFKVGDKIHIPVTVNCLDPRKQLQEIGVACWVGETDDPPRAPGDEHIVKPNDTSLRETKLAYDPAKQVATGDLIFPAQEAGKVYFSQPYYSNTPFTKRYMGGNQIKLSGPPYERTDTDLTARFRIGGNRDITLTRISDFRQLEDGEGLDKDRQVFSEQTLILNEELFKPTDSTTLAKVNYKFRSMDLKFKRGNKEFPVPKETIDKLNFGLKDLSATGTVLRTGVVTKLLVQTMNITDPVFKLLAQSQGQDLVETLEEGSLALPNKKMSPGDTWIASKNMKLAFENGDLIAPGTGTGPGSAPKPKIKEFSFREDLTYSYLGIRDRSGGGKVAVIKVEGAIGPMPNATPGSASGTVKGIVLLEADTGVIVDSDIKRQFELDSSEKGVKKRLTGTDEFKITRGLILN